MLACFPLRPTDNQMPTSTDHQCVDKVDVFGNKRIINNIISILKKVGHLCQYNNHTHHEKMSRLFDSNVTDEKASESRLRETSAMHQCSLSGSRDRKAHRRDNEGLVNIGRNSAGCRPVSLECQNGDLI